MTEPISILGVPVVAIDLKKNAEIIEELAGIYKRIHIIFTGVHGIMESLKDTPLKIIY